MSRWEGHTEGRGSWGGLGEKTLGVGTESSSHLGAGQFWALRQELALGEQAVMVRAMAGVWSLGGRGGTGSHPRLTRLPSRPRLQEHPERLPGTGSHPGSKPRAAAQVHHAGHGHHAEAGEAALPARPARLQGVLAWTSWAGHPRPRA